MRIIMIYASMTGNTREVAELIEEGIRSHGPDLELTVKEVDEANPSELEAYDGILLGAYTWGDGELPDEFLDFYEDMDTLNLQGKKAVAFGSCDSNYDQYGAAVDLLEAKLKELGAEITSQGLKIELAPSKAEQDTCREFGAKFAAQVAGAAV